MSSLDHNLVCANSLTGIGSVEEALDVLVPGRKGAATLFDAPIEEALERARTVLVDVARMPELDRVESQAASRAVKQSRKEAETAKLLLDAAVLTRIGRRDLVAGESVGAIARMAAAPTVQEVLRPLLPAHMPVLFPEVFLRSNSGFDVLVGNPPWEKLKVEEDQWWGMHIPGLRSLPMAQRTLRLRSFQESRPDLVENFDEAVAAAKGSRRAIASGPYPGIGTGDLDLYKAFAWRNWQLLCRRGRFGVVFPRAVLTGAGTEQWRHTVLENGCFVDSTLVINTKRWVFDMEPRYTVAFVTVARDVNGLMRMCGPFQSREELKLGVMDPFEVDPMELASWSTNVFFPLLPDPMSGAIFKAMRVHPSLSGGPSFDFRRVREIESTQKHLFTTDLNDAKGGIPVNTGASFGIWNPDFGPPWALALTGLERHLLEKVENSSRSQSSAFRGLSIKNVEDLPIRKARIMIRDVCRPTDSRTAIVCLIPPGITAIEKAPYLLRRHGSVHDEAYVLGVLSSIPLDWYARRVVELSMTLEVASALPIPRPPSESPLRARVISIAGRLAARDRRFADWALAVGVPVGSVESVAQQSDMEAELDALVCHLFGLSSEQVAHVFATFHRGWNFQPRLNAVLSLFDRIQHS
jgi:hypothetical protein